jgi:NAD+ synthase (glutamine-hydrolysing)
MKIALAQMEVLPGRLEENVRKMLEMIKRSKEEHVDLIIFPELCISGYILSDHWVNESFCETLMKYNTVFLEASRGIAIAYGNIYLDREINLRWKDHFYHPNKDGRTRKYNAVYVFQNGYCAERIKENNILPKGVQPKTLLPEYRIFDDERYFFSLPDIARDSGVPLPTLAQPFIIKTKDKNVKIGFELCEDLWCNDYRMGGKPLNVTNMLIDNGAQMIVNISASPWNHGKNASRDKRITFLEDQANGKFVPFLYVNNVGVQNNGKNLITFDGGTTVYNAQGRPVLIAEQAYKEELIVFEDSIVSNDPIERKEEPKIRRKFDAIVEGIKHMSQIKEGHGPLQFVVGLSGGIDSAVVASLLTVACGAENVIAINMPSAINTKRTKTVSKHVASKLGIEWVNVPINALITSHAQIFSKLDRKFNPTGQAVDLSLENIQAKIRGTSILSNFAGRYNRFFTCNGNKLEIALGYTTLYGDVNGALAPIGDLTKSEVYEMARFLNTEVFREEIIPSTLLPDALFSFDGEWIIPSAELKKDQIDPMRFGYHCALLEAYTDYIRKTPEDFFEWYLNGTLEKNLGISKELMARWEMDHPKLFVQDMEWFVSTIQKSVFKRVQSPPIIITSRSAYGYDIRESMLPMETSARYQALKSEILEMSRYVSTE